MCFSSCCRANEVGLPRKVFVHAAGDRDPTGLSQPLKPSCHVDAVSVDVILIEVFPPGQWAIVAQDSREVAPTLAESEPRWIRSGSPETVEGSVAVFFFTMATMILLPSA